MPLGMEVGLGPGDIVLDRDPAPSPQKGHSYPNFRPMSIVAKWLYVSGTETEICLGLRDIVLDGDPVALPINGTEAPIFGQCPLWPNGWMD